VLQEHLLLLLRQRLFTVDERAGHLFEAAIEQRGARGIFVHRKIKLGKSEVKSDIAKEEKQESQY
jgi:hypothetical protein